MDGVMNGLFVTYPSRMMFLDAKYDIESIDHILQQKGWFREPDRSGGNKEPPVLVSWSTDTGDEIDYVRESDVHFLEIRGPDVDSLFEEMSHLIPLLSVDDVRQLLRSNNESSIVRGLHIARYLRDGSLAEEVLRLSKHASNSIRFAAQAVIQNAVDEATGRGIEGIECPEDLSLDSVPFARYRRQILRQLVQTHSIDKQVLKAVLRQGLNDSDWEVRASATVFSARFFIREIFHDIQNCDLTPQAGDRPAPYDEGLFRLIQKIGVHCLSGKSLQPLLNPETQQEPDIPHLTKCILGEQVDCWDHTFILIQALTNPLPVVSDAQQPSVLPSGMIKAKVGYLYKPLHMPFAWVPSIEHFLGDVRPDFAVQNPIRRIKPIKGFFISAIPVKTDTISFQDWIVPSSQVIDKIQGLSNTYGVTIRLPSPDEWEMAARGPDGRLFPWGNGLEMCARQAASPWGCLEMMGKPGEWMYDSQKEEFFIGGDIKRGCASRAIGSADRRARARYIIEGQT